jgi:hypothetical protein
LGNVNREVKFTSKVFTTDVITIDKKIDDIDSVILKYNKRPKSSAKTIRVDVDLN